MSGSYSAFATLTLRSNVPQVLRQISQALTTLDTRIRATQQSMNTMLGRLTAMNTASGAIRSAALAMGSLQTAATAATGAIQTGNRSIGAQTAALNRNAAAANAAAAAARAAAAAMGAYPPRGPGVGGGGGGGGAGRGAVNAGRYGELAGLSIAASAGQRGLARIATDAGRLDTETNLARAMGFTPAEQARAMAAAVATSRSVRGTTVAENLAALAELRTTVDSVEAAAAFLPSIQRAARTTSLLTGRPAEESVRPLVRALSIRGSFTGADGNLDIEGGRRELEELTRTLIAFRGAFQPQALLGFMQQAGVAGRRMSIEAISGPMASLIQETGGPRAGTMAAAFYRQAVNGTMTKAQLARWQDVGLIPRDARHTEVSPAELARMQQQGLITAEEVAGLQRTATGGSGLVRLANPNQVVDRNLAITRPDLWFQETFTRIARAQGLTTEDQMLDLWGQLGGVETGRRFGMQMLQTREVRADTEAVRRVAPNAVDMLLNDGYLNTLANLQSSFTNFLAAIGESATADLIAVMNRLSSALVSMADWAKANPDTARILLDVAAGLTALAVVGATFAVGALAFSGLASLVGIIGSGIGGAAGLAATVGSAGFALLVGPLGIAALAGGIAYLAVTMEGKDWAALFNSIGEGLAGLWATFRRALGLDGQGGGSLPSPPPGLMPPPPGGGGNGLPGFPAIPGAPGGGLFRRSSWNYGAFEGGGGQGGGQPIILMMDGRQVGEGIMPHMDRSLNGPIQAAPRFDIRRSLPGMDFA